MDALKILFVLVLAIAIVVGGPIMTITALNTLFGLTIEVNFMTWLSSFWLSAMIGGGVYATRKK